MNIFLQEELILLIIRISDCIMRLRDKGGIFMNREATYRTRKIQSC